MANGGHYSSGTAVSGLYIKRFCSGNIVLSITRTIVRIPLWEYHIRFDSKVGKKIPNTEVLNKFKRLNNGLWIRTHPGRHKWRYLKDEPWLTQSLYHETPTNEEQQILDKLVNRFWLRPKYYVNDPYAPRKILIDDFTAQKYFYDR
ncbi:unnamed protein product [Soboliphyme baturini]|uniref:39S ribosomal protein L35, mitochondrial n=1 Tax=Soboliphyme baturini TaxID=241478 RepID=A0A183J8M2_9BILA|nr:unnamed protein product [Soboliphyme baturini]